MLRSTSLCIQRKTHTQDQPSAEAHLSLLIKGPLEKEGQSISGKAKFKVQSPSDTGPHLGSPSVNSPQAQEAGELYTQTRASPTSAQGGRGPRNKPAALHKMAAQI